MQSLQVSNLFRRNSNYEYFEHSNVYLSSLTKNLWYEQREQLDSGGGGALSQGAGHDRSFYRYAV